MNGQKRKLKTKIPSYINYTRIINVASKKLLNKNIKINNNKNDILLYKYRISYKKIKYFISLFFIL